MAQITSSSVKNLAKEMGADIVGIASADRFEGAPRGHSPQDLMPAAKSVVVMAIRIPDPVVEYDKYHLKQEEMPKDVAARAYMERFYMLMGHYSLDLMLNTMAIKLANRIEIEAGLRALPTPNTTNTGLGRGVRGALFGLFSQRHAATRAGLGEFGFSGLVLTPEFGPRQRIVSVITEVELEADPLVTEKICMRGKCGGDKGPLCFQGCADGALQLRDGIDIDKVFIDIPSRTELSRCVHRGEEGAAFGCTFIGTCLRVCPNGLKVTGKRE
jgi:epoxyqueuosine reductase